MRRFVLVLVAALSAVAVSVALAGTVTMPSAGLQPVSDSEAATLLGGTTCRYTPQDSACGVGKELPCVFKLGSDLVLNGGSRGHVRQCTTDGTDVCNKVYNPQACNPAP